MKKNRQNDSEFNFRKSLDTLRVNLALVCIDSGKISYKDKIETMLFKSKYSYLKHLSESNMHFYHHKCELKLVNSVTSSIRFFQESIH